ncbi:diguanylate cyclase/phosphodiesterase (GGDEF & EAL domains) with PAS/PAC sensor(s) [hydrothermal vent metagenome]|uniref:Diguanylate cyclase/phosphodiesterase (GGDEF & EAL domains) with PAS/PAC sensor(S) n=1 Tax=hydrothermal vent metagenome TaxID=652676 RepID=A0A1W1EAG4_9ZZZZ
MQEQKEWASFKITGLLYAVVLILAVNLYFIHSTFDTIEKDTKAMHKSGWLAGAVSHLKGVPDTTLLLRIDHTLQDMAPWIQENKDSEFYTGSKGLQTDFKQVRSCWQQSKDIKTCTTAAKELNKIIVSIVEPKERKLGNILYLILLITLFITLYLIYFIRLYIQRQIEKHAIYDVETSLFNQKYFQANLATAMARARREHTPLSIFCLSIDNFESYNDKEQQYLIQKTAHLLGTVTRDSDTVSRYGQNHFSVLMPLADSSNAVRLEERMKNAIEKFDFQISFEPQFSFKITQLKENETKEEFTDRSAC